MASNSKSARKEAEKKLQCYIDFYENFFNTYYNNSIFVENSPLVPANSNSDSLIELPKRYLLNTLRTFGAIAYDKATGLFLRFTERAMNVYGLPVAYQLYGYNGLLFERTPDEVVILRANDLKYPIQDYINMQARKLADIDNAIFQNLDAVKTMTIVKVDTEQELLSLVNLENARRIGSSVVFKASSKLNDNPLNVASTGAQYLGDKFQELRTQILRETLSNLGFAVSNEDKKERVQSAEITTLNIHGLDAINVLIDTFNYDAEYGGLSIRLKANTELSIIMDQQLEQQEENKKGEDEE